MNLWCAILLVQTVIKCDYYSPYPSHRTPYVVFYKHLPVSWLESTIDYVNNLMFTDQDEKLVLTSQGWVRGDYRLSYRRFLGIPYAAPPIGNRRWQPPEPFQQLGSGVIFDATSFGAHCLQWQDEKSMAYKTIMNPRSHSSEDCLYLNVITPRKKEIPPGGLPVLVFIHGGTYVTGSGSVAMYDHRNLVKKYQNFIAVTFNYRLGPMGYLASRAVKKTTRDGSYGNFGLQDQMLALQWVNKNIQSFGGDPNRITLSGQSAGSMSANYLMLLQKKNSILFHQAVFMSGVANSMPIRTLDDSITQRGFDNLAAKLGCGSFDDPTEQMECLGRLDGQIIVDTAHQMNFTYMWGPCLDKTFIKQDPRTMASQGDFPLIPVIYGNTHDEGSVFALDIRSDTEADYQKFLSYNFPSRIYSTLSDRYAVAKFSGSVFDSFVAITTDAFFSCQIMAQADVIKKRGGNVRLYRFDYVNEMGKLVGWLMYRKKLGSFHGSDLALFTGSLGMSLFEDATTRNMIRNLLIDFLVTGTVDPSWPEYSPDSILVMKHDPEISSILRQDECKFWNSRRMVLPKSFLSESLFVNHTLVY